MSSYTTSPSDQASTPKKATRSHNEQHQEPGKPGRERSVQVWSGRGGNSVGLWKKSMRRVGSLVAGESSRSFGKSPGLGCSRLNFGRARAPPRHFQDRFPCQTAQLWPSSRALVHHAIKAGCRALPNVDHERQAETQAHEWNRLGNLPSHCESHYFCLVRCPLAGS